MSPRRTGCVWSIALRESGQIIGDCGLEPNDRHLRGELGYCLHPDHWNKGFVTEALAEIIRWSFEEREPRLERLAADHYPEKSRVRACAGEVGVRARGPDAGLSLLKDGVRRDVVRWARVRTGGEVVP